MADSSYTKKELESMAFKSIQKVAKALKVPDYKDYEEDEEPKLIKAILKAQKEATASPKKAVRKSRSRSPAKKTARKASVSRSRSPAKKTTRRSRSPAKKTARKASVSRSRSPAKKTTRRSRSPAKKTTRKASASRSRSPAKKTTRRSRSPAKKTTRKASASRSRSPAKKTTRRSRSPAKKTARKASVSRSRSPAKKTARSVSPSGVKYTKSQLQGMLLKDLKEVSKGLGIAGYYSINAGNKETFIEKVLAAQKKTAPSKSPAKSPVRRAPSPKPSVSSLDKDSLSKMTIIDLKALAKSKGIGGVTGLKKAVIVDKIAEFLSSKPSPAKKVVKKVVEEESEVDEEEDEESEVDEEEEEPEVEEEEEEESVSGEDSEEEDEEPVVIKAVPVKMSISDLKNLLIAKGIKEGLSNKTYEELEEMLNASTCNPKEDEFCDDDKVCDTRNGICVDESKVPRNLSKVEINGKKVVGSKAAVQALVKAVEESKRATKREEEPLVEEEVSAEELVEQIQRPSKKEEVVVEEDVYEEDLPDEAGVEDLAEVLSDIQEEQEQEDIAKLGEVQKKILRCMGLLG